MKTIKYEPKSDFSFCLQINFFSTCEINLPDFFSFFFFLYKNKYFYLCSIGQFISVLGLA